MLEFSWLLFVFCIKKIIIIKMALYGLVLGQVYVFVFILFCHADIGDVC